MKTQRRFAVTILAAVLVSVSAITARADDDPPGRAVEISYMSGQISIQPGGVNDWVAATINRPLTTADRVWADQNSRAELDLGTAVLRLDSETSMTLSNVDDQTAQFELDQGSLNLHLRRLYDGQIYEVDTPNLAFTVTKPGDYRFDVDPNGDTTMVTVWRGEGEATGQGNGVSIRSGQRATFSNGTSLDHEVAGAPDFDGFDDWCRVRDQREDTSASARYVSPDMVGYEDLDQYGTWRTVPDYGAIWVPTRVQAGWAPYRFGHWVWVEPWGWTWVDDAPWGFAPCHYGRWVYAGGYWGWAPGPVAPRPVYAPAMVAWVGGSNWGVSVAVGGGPAVGWFPLGYGEPYVPGYHVSRGYFERVNVTNTRITNITYVTNNYYNNTSNVTRIHYVNRSVPGAMTAVSTDVMIHSQPVGRSNLRLPAGAVERAQIDVVAPVAPSRTSVLGIHAGVVAAAPRRTVYRPVVYHAAPPPRPVSFEAKQQFLQQHPGRPLDVQTEQQLRARAPQQPMARPENGRPENQNPGRPAGVGAMNPNGNQNNVNPGGRYVPRPPEPGTNKTMQPAQNPPGNMNAHPSDHGNEGTPSGSPQQTYPPQNPGAQPNLRRPYGSNQPQTKDNAPSPEMQPRGNPNGSNPADRNVYHSPQGQVQPQNNGGHSQERVPHPPQPRVQPPPRQKGPEPKQEKKEESKPEHHDRSDLQRGGNRESRARG